MRSTIAGAVAALAAAEPAYIAGATALYVASLLLVGARWRVFVRALGGTVGVGRATLANLGGIAAGNLVPATRVAGEACRIALVRQAGSVTWRQAAIAAVWDRLAEIPPIAALATVSLFAARQLIPVWRVGMLAIGATAMLVGAGFIVRALRRSRRMFGSWVEYLSLDRIGIATYANGVALASLMWIQDVLRLTCATRAVGVSLAPTELAALSMLAMIGGLVPGVAGLGPVEGTLMVGLLSFGVPPASAVAVTAVERAISYGLSTVGGALVITIVGGTLTLGRHQGAVGIPS